MAATPQEVRDAVASAVRQLQSAGNVASVFAPQYAGYIAIGQAVASLSPEIADNITAWIQGATPTPAEEQAVAEKLAVLANPNLP